MTLTNPTRLSVVVLIAISFSLLPGCVSGDETSKDEFGSSSGDGDGQVGDGQLGSGGTSAIGDGDGDSAWGDGDSGDGDGDTAGFDGANTNISFSGSQDFGYFRRLVDSGVVPAVGDFDASGFFAEHHTELPEPACGERVCLQTMLGVMGNLTNGNNCTLLQLGLNSPIAANPEERPPLSLSVVVDVSGSMNTDGKIDFVRSGLERLIDGMRDGDRLALVTYNSQVDVLFPMAAVSLRRSELRDLARSLVAQGSTNLYDGLEEGYNQIFRNYDSGRQNRVILLSDGEPTAGNTNLDDIQDMSRAYNSDGAGLTTVGLGTSFNIELMRGLAELGDGNFYFLDNANAVDEVFTEELAYFTVPVAFDLELVLTSGDQYSVGRVYGTNQWVNTPTGGLLEVPSVFIAHRESADDTFGGEGRRGGGSALLVELMPNRSSDDGSGITEVEVARVDVSFREPGSNEIVTDTIIINYPNAPWITPPRGYFQSTDVTVIHKSFVMLNIYTAFEMSSDMFHDGDASGALEILDRVIASVEDYNSSLDDVDMVEDLKLLNQVRDLIADQGFRVSAGWAPPEDPWPVDDDD